MFVVLGVVGGLFGGGVGMVYAAVSALGAACLQAKSVWPPIAAFALSTAGLFEGKFHPALLIPYILIAAVLAIRGAQRPPAIIVREEG